MIITVCKPIVYRRIYPYVIINERTLRALRWITWPGLQTDNVPYAYLVIQIHKGGTEDLYRRPSGRVAQACDRVVVGAVPDADVQLDAPDAVAVRACSHVV